MAKLVFDQTGQRFYETGVKNAVLYVYDKATGAYGNGVAWNGVTNITLSPSGAEATALYADDIKYLNLVSAEEMGGTIEAYTYPDEFGVCDGSVSPVAGMKFGQQARSTFALVFKTTVGNDVDANAGYKLHVIYGCLAAPSEKAYATINDSPEAITFSWELSTTPVSVELGDGNTYKPTSYVELNSTDFTPETMAKLTAVEDKLYGSADEEASLLMPAEIYNLLNA